MSRSGEASSRALLPSWTLSVATTSYPARSSRVERPTRVAPSSSTSSIFLRSLIIVLLRLTVFACSIRDHFEMDDVQSVVQPVQEHSGLDEAVERRFRDGDHLR